MLCWVKSVNFLICFAYDDIDPENTIENCR